LVGGGLERRDELGHEAHGHLIYDAVFPALQTVAAFVGFVGLSDTAEEADGRELRFIDEDAPESVGSLKRQDPCGKVLEGLDAVGEVAAVI